jgi:hypothetical protein
MSAKTQKPRSRRHTWNETTFHKQPFDYSEIALSFVSGALWAAVLTWAALGMSGFFEPVDRATVEVVAEVGHE